MGPKKSRTHDYYLFRFRKVGDYYGTVVAAVRDLSKQVILSEKLRDCKELHVKEASQIGSLEHF